MVRKNYADLPIVYRPEDDEDEGPWYDVEPEPEPEADDYDYAREANWYERGIGLR